MKTLEYKGLTGDIVKEDDYYYGHIQGIDAIVSYEGDTLEELRKYFEEAVDEYLYMCEKYNIDIYTNREKVAVQTQVTTTLSELRNS